MARSNTISTNREKTLKTITIDMSDGYDELNIKSKQLATLLEIHKNKIIDPGTIANELRISYKDGLLYLNGENTRKKYGDCRCTHPPSFGHCIFGACVSVFKYGLKITINI